MSAVAQDENKLEMSNHEKFLFDLNGFIVLRNVLNEEEVQQLNDAVDANILCCKSRDCRVENAVKDSKLSAEGSRVDLEGCFGTPSRRRISTLAIHRKLAPYITALCEKGID